MTTPIKPVNYDTSLGHSNDVLETDATTVGNLAGKGIHNGEAGAGGIGDIPDYAALMKAIGGLQKQSISLPPDMMAVLDNEAMNQLGSHEMTTALGGGAQAAATRQELGDQVGNVAASGNMTATRNAANQSLKVGNQAAASEADKSGAAAQSVLSEQAKNKLQQYIMQAQAFHANAANQNNVQAMNTGLQNSETNGLIAAQGIGNSALSALASASLANNQTQFGNAMTMVRGGISGLSSAAGTISSLTAPTNASMNSGLGAVNNPYDSVFNDNSGGSVPGGSDSGVGGGGPAE